MPDTVGDGPATSSPAPLRRKPTRRTTVVDLDTRSAVALGIAMVCLVGIFNTIDAAPGALTFLVVAMLMTLALDPLVCALQRRFDVRRGAAVAIVLSIGLAAFIALIVFMGPPTVDQARSLQRDLPDVLEELYDLPFVGETLRENDAADTVQDWISELPTRLSGESREIRDAAESVSSGALAGLVTMLLMVALLLDGPRLIALIRRVVPVGRREAADDMGRIFYNVVGRYFAGSVFVAVLHGFATLVTGLLLGVPLSPLLATWAAITGLIPQVGGFIGGVPFVLVAFTESATAGVAAFIFFLLYLNFENNILSPVVVGHVVDLSPLTTMVAAILGASVAGVPGALLAVPLIGATKAMYFELRPPADPREEKPIRAGPLGRLLGRAMRSGDGAGGQ